jgi:hypothetical protein
MVRRKKDNLIADEKTTEMINEETDDLIEHFSLDGKYRMIGSQSLRAIQYGSDYDIDTELKGTTGEKVAKMLQKAYTQAKKNPDYWITDFKAGHDDRLIYKGDYSKDSVNEYLKEHKDLISASRANKIKKATGEDLIKMIRDLYILRWKPDDIKRGWVKMIDGKRKYLKDAVLDKTITKIDLLGKVGNQFVEVSENYTIKTKSGKTNNVPTTTDEILETYEDEIQYYSKNNSFKALKRLFAALKLDNPKGNKKALDSLVGFFNSQIGYLNKIKNELGILEQVLTQDFRKAKWKDIEANLQYIKEQVSNIYEIPIKENVFSKINDMTAKNVLKGVRELIDYFGELINPHAKSFLQKLL